jgi:hypothetical protein
MIGHGGIPGGSCILLGLQTDLKKKVLGPGVLLSLSKYRGAPATCLCRHSTTIPDTMTVIQLHGCHIVIMSPCHHIQKSASHYLPKEQTFTFLTFSAAGG